jgi:hypothetical protein
VQAARDAEGADEGVLLADDQRSEFTARIDGRQSVEPGTTVELAVDHRALHAFDVDSGLALRAEVPERPLAATA